MNTTHFARYAKLFIAGTTSVHEALANHPEGIDLWRNELEIESFWKSWDERAFSNRRRFQRCGATAERQETTFKTRVIELLANFPGITRQELQAQTGASRTCVQKIIDELKANQALTEHSRQLFIAQHQTQASWTPRKLKRPNSSTITTSTPSASFIPARVQASSYGWVSPC